MGTEARPFAAVPYLVFGGLQVWLVEAPNEQEAVARWRADWQGRHKALAKIEPHEIRVRPLRLQDEAWLRSSVEDKPGNQAGEFLAALDKLREAVK